MHVPWTLADDERNDERGAPDRGDLAGLMRALRLAFASVLASASIAVTLVAQDAPRRGGASQEGPRWTLQNSGVAARFRGISAAGAMVVWACGADGTIVRTIDGGKTWRTVTPPPDTQKFDFRDIDAISQDTAYLLSIGPGAASRIFKTSDGGRTWKTQFVNRDQKAFFDAMVFWSEWRGVAVSDSVDGRFVLLMTEDGGDTWTQVPAAGLPLALPNEGAFAASGTNVTVPIPISSVRYDPLSRRRVIAPPPADKAAATTAASHVWLGTGAAATARVLRSSDAGKTWKAVATPLPAGPSAGIFSVSFRDILHGVIVGGDYKNEAGAVDNVAITSDGGETWTLVKDKALSGFRSVVAYAPRKDSRTLVAVGPSGSDLSTDDGRTWRPITPAEGGGFHTFSFAPGGKAGWAAGEKGRIARLDGLP
jgi:photosystem II stability/assembly factor-like uncharacterized protein